MTLYAAIGTNLTSLVTYVGDTTNNEDFRAFAKVLVAALPRRERYFRKPVLVADNHRSHYNCQTVRLLEKHVRILYTPTASCCFNSIETAFSKIKRVYKNRITKIALRRDYTRDSALAVLDLACAEVTPAMQRRLCHANRTYMNEFLTQDKQLPPPVHALE